MNRIIVVHPDAESLARDAARRIEAAAAEAIRRRGRFTLALAGGSTPKRTYELLAHAASTLDWTKTFIVMGDERLVPLGDPRSNFAMARDALLAHVPLPPNHVFPVPVELEDEDRIVRAYASLLDALALQPDGAGRPPRLDLILLGLGSDGHTASLFPGHPSLDERSAILVTTAPGTLPPPVRRVTFTYPMLNAARCVMFLVAGADKAEAVGTILGGTPPITERPAAGVRPSDGALEWLLDDAAAAKLAPGLVASSRSDAGAGSLGSGGDSLTLPSALPSAPPSAPPSATRIRLLVSDVDGTLVNHAKEMTPKTIEAIERLRTSGVAVALISSRAPAGMRLLTQHFDPTLPFGAFNGGVVVDACGREVRRAAIDAEAARIAVEIMDTHGIDAWAFTDDAWYARRTDTPHARRERVSSALEPIRWDTATPLPSDVFKLTAVSDDDGALTGVHDAIGKRLAAQLAISRSQTYYLDLTSPEANKGDALRALATALDIPLALTAAIGDGLNDLPMFAAAGTSIAMGNAAEVVRKAATMVTTSNEEEGFAQAVARSILCEAPSAIPSS